VYRHKNTTQKRAKWRDTPLLRRISSIAISNILKTTAISHHRQQRTKYGSGSNNSFIFGQCQRMPHSLLRCPPSTKANHKSSRDGPNGGKLQIQSGNHAVCLRAAADAFTTEPESGQTRTSKQTSFRAISRRRSMESRLLQILSDTQGHTLADSKCTFTSSVAFLKSFRSSPLSPTAAVHRQTFHIPFLFPEQRAPDTFHPITDPIVFPKHRAK